MGPVEMLMHGDGHETRNSRAPVRIWASSSSRVWITKAIDRHRFKKIYHQEHSRLVHTHRWLNRYPQWSRLQPPPLWTIDKKGGNNQSKGFFFQRHL